MDLLPGSRDCEENEPRGWRRSAAFLQSCRCLCFWVLMDLILTIFHLYGWNWHGLAGDLLVRPGFTHERLVCVAFDNEIIHKYSLYGPKAHDTVSVSSWSDFCLFSARSGTSCRLETGQSPTSLWKQKSGYWAAVRELRGCWQKPTWAKRLQ